MAVVIGQINFKDDLKLNLFRKGPKRIYVNESILKKQSEIKNYIRSVCFCSNDIDIVRSEPSYRRTWIDKVVSQLEPVYLDLISRFNRLLKQRSHFWRSESFLKTQSTDIVESFDIQMSIISTRIFRRRRRALLKIKPYVEYWHNHLSKSQEQIDINYLSGIQNISPEEEEEEVISKKIAEQLLNQRSIEALTGKCNFGPHRDDVEFLINNVSVRKYGSSGQQRTFILALKMAELDLLTKTLNVPPILILDDVLAELDLTNEQKLIHQSKHLLLELYRCDREKLNDESFLRCILNRAAKLANATVLNLISNKFEPQGVTAIALLAESHISIHTWPESNYSAVDIFTCGQNMMPELASQYLIESLMAKEHSLRVIERNPPSAVSNQIRTVV